MGHVVDVTEKSKVRLKRDVAGYGKQGDVIWLECLMADEWIIKGHADGRLSKKYRPHERRRIRDQQVTATVQNVGSVGAKILSPGGR